MRPPAQQLADLDLRDSAVFDSPPSANADQALLSPGANPDGVDPSHLAPRASTPYNYSTDSDPDSDGSGQIRDRDQGQDQGDWKGIGGFLRRKSTQRRKGSRREKVKMVGHHLQQAFRSWFRETEDNGLPILPGPLSKKYTVLPSVLGQGSFAVVKPVVERETGTERALKIIAKKPLKDSNEKMLKEEIAILGKVEHPHVIKMWDMYETKEGVFIVTDLCRGGELFDRLVEKVHYNELDARHIMKQVISGVEYLHSHDIIHRDLKPENILLRDKSEHSDVVISDFGLSRFIPEEGLLMTACGSPQYVSPEVLLGKGYGPAVDIWSAGVIAYSLLAGYTPFYGDDQPTLFQQIIEMKVEFEPQYWGDISDTAKEFICRCLCPASERMTASEALKHPWLANLPELHDEAMRGVCLKTIGAQRNLTAMQKVRKAVTAVEAVNHLNRLHTLRQQHGSAGEKLSRLVSVASAIRSHRRGDSLLPSPTRSSAGDNGDRDADFSASTATITPEAEKTPKKDSGMALDLVVMSMFLPKNYGPGTSDVAAAADATADGGNPKEPKRTSNGGPPGSPTASTSGRSDHTATPTQRPRQKSRSNSTLTALLDQYKSTNLPTSARLDPSIKTREPAKLTLSNAWRYIPFLVNQGVSIGSAMASHAIYGPPKKSWGLEMSVFTRIMRDVADYSEFASIAGLQAFLNLGSFLPTPKDGLITPVSFRVKKRGLRGFLKESDEAEDGKRELTGEWVGGKQTWRRLQAEWRDGKQKGKERVILYIHGGAYFVMSAATHRPLTISLSKYTECRVFGINYRLAPDTRFPGALHDCVSSWFRLVEDLGIPPSNIVLGADSAGGGLALATMMYLRDNGYELPSGAMLFSPWVDLTMSCDSWETNSKFDYLPMPKSGDHMNPVAAYLGDNINQYLTHPYVSPLFGDLHGLPPLLIQAGDAEVLRDEVTLLAHKASQSGVAVRHELYEDCVHVFQAFLFLDASRKALQSARHFVRTALDKRGKRKAEVNDRTRREIDREMRTGMGNARGERVEPGTGELKGSRHAVSTADSEERAMADDEEDWELELERRASVDRDAANAAAAGEAIGDSLEAVSKMLGTDDRYVTRTTDQGAGADDEDEAPTPKPMTPTTSKQGLPNVVNGREISSSSTPTSTSNNVRTSRTQPSSPTEQFKPLSRDLEHRSSHADGAGSSTPIGSGSGSRHRRALTASMSQMSLEDAQARANLAMQQQGQHGHHLSRFHAPTSRLTPKIRSRSASHQALDTLLQSFEQGPAVQTNVFTPDK